mmetsp:Transcript_1918/g.5434  ORF Transcript_1918/g.5434 Transcript_1918/m.5434 type:complete len:261 (+) Transcript_1918:701-1483(+)
MLVNILLGDWHVKGREGGEYIHAHIRVLRHSKRDRVPRFRVEEDIPLSIAHLRHVDASAPGPSRSGWRCTLMAVALHLHVANCVFNRELSRHLDTTAQLCPESNLPIVHVANAGPIIGTHDKQSRDAYEQGRVFLQSQCDVGERASDDDGHSCRRLPQRLGDQLRRIVHRTRSCLWQNGCIHTVYEALLVFETLDPSVHFNTPLQGEGTDVTQAKRRAIGDWDVTNARERGNCGYIDRPAVWCSKSNATHCDGLDTKHRG